MRHVFVRIRAFLAILAAGALGASTVQAHNDPLNFDAYEAWCVDIPLLVRKGAGRQQVFEFTNISDQRVFWIFLAQDTDGTLAVNLSRSPGIGSGVLEPYRSASVANTVLQRRNVAVIDQEPLLLCFSEFEDPGAGFGHFDGTLIAREMRRISGHWEAIPLTSWWTWWTVITKPEFQSGAQQSLELSSDTVSDEALAPHFAVNHHRTGGTMNEPEVRNPRYAGATVGDLVRALVRPRKPKAGKNVKEQGEQPAGVREDRIRYQRPRETPD